jgi:hypothetical protein
LLFTLLCIVLLIYYTCDVNICVEIDPGTHMPCTRLFPLETGVTEVVSKLVSFIFNSSCLILRLSEGSNEKHCKMIKLGLRNLK